MSIRTGKPLTFLKRDGSHSRPHIHPQSKLLPRILFKGRPAILDAWDRMAKLQEQVVRYGTEQRELTAQAAAAKQQYHRDVREAMATGGDVDKVVNGEVALLERAQEAQDRGEEARRGATAHGYVLGGLIAEAAPELLAPSEKQMAQAHADVLDAVANLESSWSRWSAAWHVRRLLGSAWLFGGQLGAYREESPLPPEVAAALATLTEYTTNLDRLKVDEAEVLAFRANEERATASNASAARALAPTAGLGFRSIG